MTDSLADYTAITERYLAAWNAVDPEDRRRAIRATFTPTARYVDPLTAADGVDAIDAAIAAAQSQFPGFRFRLTGPVDGHHEQLRFGWELGPGSEPAPIAGFDVAVVDRDGRVATVLGFLDRVPNR